MSPPWRRGTLKGLTREVTLYDSCLRCITVKEKQGLNV